MSTKPRLEGKVALITGGASGIGEEAARLFAEHGALVVVVDIQDELGRQVASSIGDEVATYRRCDVRDEKQVEETVRFAVEKHGKVDVLFSNAGILDKMSNILDLDLDTFDTVMATNVRGMAAFIKHAARAMVDKSTRGSIICTSSLASLIGAPSQHAYTASKSAVAGLVRSACRELGEYGIRVNCVSPFAVATPMSVGLFNLPASEIEESMKAVANLKGVVLKAKHVAETVLFLASDESAYISGQNLAIDGGFGIARF